MPNLDSSYGINQAEVIAESVQGELLIINLANGTYYSSEGTGDQIWALLAAHASLAHIAAWLSARYRIDPVEVQQAVLAFVEELEGERLVVLHAGNAASTPEPPAVNGEVFKPPVLHKYTDFQDLLRLDPIHDVDRSAGWPHAKPTA